MENNFFISNLVLAFPYLENVTIEPNGSLIARETTHPYFSW